MGYSHYFRGLIAKPQVIAEAAKIIEASGVTACGPRGDRLPVRNETYGIKLNGSAAAGEAYETFSLPRANAAGRGNHAWFRTTENKHYDVVVHRNPHRRRPVPPGTPAQRGPLGALDCRPRPIRSGRSSPLPGPEDRTRTRHRSPAPSSSLGPQTSSRAAPVVVLKCPGISCSFAIVD